MTTQDYLYGNPSYGRREDAPLPPRPVSTGPTPSGYPLHHQRRTSDSPASSPFSDNSYPSYPLTGQTSVRKDNMFHNVHEGRASPNDPFSDRNAIQMQTQQPKYDNSSPTGYAPGYEPYPEDTQGSRGRRRHKKKRFFSGKIPWVVYTLTIIQTAVFIAEIARNAVLTKSPIMIKPSFNPMIGPSTYVLINMGARYVPCMRNTDKIQNSPNPLFFPCPNTTSATLTEATACGLSELCGFGGVPEPRAGGSLSDRPEPNQWFRFIVPIFLHAGIIHIGFNMILQLTIGKDMERQIGPIRFFLVYFSSGIFGFVLGGNFAAQGIASTGASGALFGILALTLLDLLYHWSKRKSPVKELIFIILDVAIAFVLGLLPGLDNFSHIGGFLMGLVLGVCILHSPDKLRQRTGMDEPPYSTVPGAAAGPASANTGVNAFVRQPVGFFKGRKPAWWAWWLIRAAALVGVLVSFILLLNNFYIYRNTCSWCKHLSCLPIKDWCDLGNIQSKPLKMF